MPTDIERVAQLWDQHTAELGGRASDLHWKRAGLEYVRYKHKKISGDPETDWLTYTLKTYFKDQLPLNKCLSLGCGSGSLERELARLNVFQQCDAYDIAPESIRKAKEFAQAENFQHIDYYVADVNTLQLPEQTYDAVWLHQSLHHIEALEYVSAQISQALKPAGYLILKEYVGQSRLQFSLRQQEVANFSLQLLPEKYRQVKSTPIFRELKHESLINKLSLLLSRLIKKLRKGELDFLTLRRHITTYKKPDTYAIKTKINFPTADEVQAIDPSEAIRSQDIVSVIQDQFEIVEIKQWPGYILLYILATIEDNFSDEDPQSQELIRMLLCIQDTLVRCGEIEPELAYIVARPRPRKCTTTYDPVSEFMP